jgi:hypothetical protein
MAFKSNLLPLLLFVLPVVWIIGLLAASSFGGWSELAAHFPRNADPAGRICASGSWFNLVYMRYWTKYSGAIYFEAADDALYLTMIPLFRPFHPPLRIPWDEIRMTQGVFFLVLILGSAEQIPLRVSSRLAGKLELVNRLERREARS